MTFHVCDHQETYGTYYKKWRLEVTATLGKFEIALLSRWVKNSWSTQKGSIWGAQVFHCEKMFTGTNYTNISLPGKLLAYVWPHTVQEAKADSRNRVFLLSILNAPPSFPIPLIQFEPWARVSHAHPARWEGIILMCSVRLPGRTWGLQSPSMAHLGTQTEHCTGQPAAPCWPYIFSSPEHKGSAQDFLSSVGNSAAWPCSQACSTWCNPSGTAAMFWSMLSSAACI